MYESQFNSDDDLPLNKTLELRNFFMKKTNNTLKHF